MGNYKNPIPHVDDENASKTYYIGFTFEESVTQAEATEGINELLAKNNGVIPGEWIRMGEPKTIRHVLPQD